MHKTQPTIAKIISLAMEAKGYSQQALQKASGLTQSNISRILDGSQKPTIKTLQRLGPCLGLTVAQMTGEVDLPAFTKDDKTTESWLTKYWHQLSAPAQIVLFKVAATEIGAIERRVADRPLPNGIEDRRRLLSTPMRHVKSKRRGARGN